ncbi:MAG: hypothetical protein M5R40_03595 [Anaerolineae bacterium]|nr:hypothetical protein [Anaerolineae bacterium]
MIRSALMGRASQKWSRGSSEICPMIGGGFQLLRCVAVAAGASGVSVGVGAPPSGVSLAASGGAGVTVAGESAANWMGAITCGVALDAHQGVGGAKVAAWASTVGSGVALSRNCVAMSACQFDSVGVAEATRRTGGSNDCTGCAL